MTTQETNAIALSSIAIRKIFTPNPDGTFSSFSSTGDTITRKELEMYLTAWVLPYMQVAVIPAKERDFLDSQILERVNFSLAQELHHYPHIAKKIRSGFGRGDEAF